MTIEEFSKIPFRVVGHVSWEHEHTMTYASVDGRYGFCDHTPIRRGGEFGKGYRHWRIGDKVYKKTHLFIEALSKEPRYAIETEIPDVNVKPHGT